MRNNIKDGLEISMATNECAG